MVFDDVTNTVFEISDKLKHARNGDIVLGDTFSVFDVIDEEHREVIEVLGEQTLQSRSSGRRSPPCRCVGNADDEAAGFDEVLHQTQREVVPQQESVQTGVHDARTESNRLDILDDGKLFLGIAQEIVFFRHAGRSRQKSSHQN